MRVYSPVPLLDRGVEPTNYPKKCCNLFFSGVNTMLFSLKNGVVFITRYRLFIYTYLLKFSADVQ